MTLNISVKHDMKRLAKELDRVQKRDLPKAVSGALNKTRGNVVKVVKKEVADRTGVIQKDVKAALSEEKSTPQRLWTSIESSKRTFNLIRFATPAAIRGARKAAGLKAKAFGKKARVFPGVFVGNKGRTAFVREGGKIRAAHGPSIPRAMISPKVQREVRKRIEEQFPKNLRSQLKRTFAKRR